MNLSLDKRIKDITDIYSVTDGSNSYKFLNKKGYFANDIYSFKDLDAYTCYGEYKLGVSLTECSIKDLRDWNQAAYQCSSLKSFEYNTKVFLVS